MLAKLTVEMALDAELTDHLGHEKNAPKTGSNTRNGYSSKTRLSDDGEIELNTLRERENGRHGSQLQGRRYNFGARYEF